VVGIEAEEYEETSRDAGLIAGSTLAKDQLVDFIRIVPGEAGISEYLLQKVKPFYQRDQ
jgi:hypothetical protein